MRIVLLVLAGWSGSMVLAAGVFVALMRGGGGTDLGSAGAAASPVPVAGRRPSVDLPQPREGSRTHQEV